MMVRGAYYISHAPTVRAAARGGTGAAEPIKKWYGNRGAGGGEYHWIRVRIPDSASMHDRSADM